MATNPDQTSPPSAWLVGLFLGAVDAVAGAVSTARRLRRRRVR